MAAGRVTAKFCAKTLEAEANLSSVFLSPIGARLRGGRLRSATQPTDFQRHEVGPGGQVLHLTSLGAIQGGGRPPVTSSPSSSSTRRKTGATENEPPWSVTLYAKGNNPYMAKRRLASELGVPPGSIRMAPSLNLPGTSVQVATIPRGLPSNLARGGHGMPGCNLQSGLLPGIDPIVAVGRAPQLPGGTRSTGSGGTKPSKTVQEPTWRRNARSQNQRELPQTWRCEGHRYTVVLRGVDRRQCEDGSADELFARLTEEGFVNFFDIGSFGLAEVRRHQIGAALWTGRWDQAAKLLLTANRSPDGEFSNEAIHALLKHDLARGLELMPDEGVDGLRALAMQLVLKKSPHEALRAAAPPSVWVRHIGAVSKMAWNYAAAARLSRHPKRPIAGDLVWDSELKGARLLKADEVSKWRLQDVVLPLPRPGDHVEECISRLDMMSVLQRLVPHDDAAADDFPFKVENILPRYRRIVGTPTDLTWDVTEAASGTNVIPLVPCDLSRMGSGSSSQDDEGFPGDQTASKGKGRKSRTGNNNQGVALRLRFSLPRGEGAEAVLREILGEGPSDFVEGFGRRDETF